jgi:hypothetical protein
MIYTHVRQQSTVLRPQCKPLCTLFCLKLFADVLAALSPSSSPIYIYILSLRPLQTNVRRHGTPQGLPFKPMDITCSRDLVEIWIGMIAAPPDGHHTLHLPPLTPASTDVYAPGYYATGASIQAYGRHLQSRFGGVMD